MKKQAFNPYLPSYEYVPDGEPHIFGDRVYIYGSHDRFGGKSFCLNDYVSWSAPTNDLSDWRYEGVIYERKQDPDGKSGMMRAMYAPDVCQGPDGKYYLYYFLGYMGLICVAVCDEPAGKYKYLGHVKYKDGILLGKKKEPLQFDPGVLRDDDGRVYLYTGFGPDMASPFMIGKKPTREGAMVFELESDMLTIKGDLRYIGAPAHKAEKGTGYEGHAFFEASSMRKFNGTYYFIYSSYLGHELCYATSSSPTGPFKFGGTLVSIGDIGLGECKNPKSADNFTGNTHGSIVCINGEYYVFYHRQTNRHQFSRQACAEKLTMRSDGGFDQVPITSCGLNGGPLKGEGEYEARIACMLKGPKGNRFYGITKRTCGNPYFTQGGKDREDNPDQYIANMRGGAVAGYRYFDFSNPSSISLKVSGKGGGKMIVTADGKQVSSVDIPKGKGMREAKGPLKDLSGVVTLELRYFGKGFVNLHAISFS